MTNPTTPIVSTNERVHFLEGFQDILANPPTTGSLVRTWVPAGDKSENIVARCSNGLLLSLSFLHRNDFTATILNRPEDVLPKTISGCVRLISVQYVIEVSSSAADEPQLVALPTALPGQAAEVFDEYLSRNAHVLNRVALVGRIFEVMFHEFETNVNWEVKKKKDIPEHVLPCLPESWDRVVIMYETRQVDPFATSLEKRPYFLRFSFPGIFGTHVCRILNGRRMEELVQTVGFHPPPRVSTLQISPFWILPRRPIQSLTISYDSTEAGKEDSGIWVQSNEQPKRINFHFLEIRAPKEVNVWVGAIEDYWGEKIIPDGLCFALRNPTAEDFTQTALAMEIDVEIKEV